MAIPGAVMFALAGITGQFISNLIDQWRASYIFKHEDEWSEARQVKSKEDILRDKVTEYENKFGIFDQFGLKKGDVEKRIGRLRGEIEKLDGMLKKVDDEIAALEKASSNSNAERE